MELENGSYITHLIFILSPSIHLQQCQLLDKKVQIWWWGKSMEYMDFYLLRLCTERRNRGQHAESKKSSKRHFKFHASFWVSSAFSITEMYACGLRTAENTGDIQEHLIANKRCIMRLPYMTSTKIIDFLPPPPCPYLSALPTPLEYGHHIWKPTYLHYKSSPSQVV